MVDEIQQHVHAMRRILRPDAKLGADDWLKMHTTDRLHITNHDKRVREAASKNAAGIAQDQESAQAIAQGSVPWSQTPEALAERAKIEGQVRVANAQAIRTWNSTASPTGQPRTWTQNIPRTCPKAHSRCRSLPRLGNRCRYPDLTASRCSPWSATASITTRTAIRSRTLARPSVLPFSRKWERRAARMSLRCSLTKGGWMPGRWNPPILRPLSTFAQQGLYGIDMMQMPDGSIGSALLNRRTGQFKPITIRNLVHRLHLRFLPGEQEPRAGAGGQGSIHASG